MYIKVKNVRAFVKSQGRRVGKDYLIMLDNHIQEMLERGCRTHNGGKVTLDQGVAVLTGLAKKEGKK